MQTITEPHDCGEMLAFTLSSSSIELLQSCGVPKRELIQAIAKPQVFGHPFSTKRT
ncbi:MAG: hypothetical protein PWP37_1249 [Thermotogota bacterium]|nr:hypothetical protein [Thermotogota bacterium]